MIAVASGKVIGIIVLTADTVLYPADRALRDFIMSAATRRSILFCCGARPVKKPAPSAARRVQHSSLMSHTYFKSFSAKNLCYKNMHVQQLFFADFWPHIREESITRPGFQV